MLSPCPPRQPDRAVVKTPMPPQRSRDTRSPEQLIAGTSPQLVLHAECAITASSRLGNQLLYAVLPSHYTALNLLPYQVGALLSANQ